MEIKTKKKKKMKKNKKEIRKRRRKKMLIQLTLALFSVFEFLKFKMLSSFETFSKVYFYSPLLESHFWRLRFDDITFSR